ncbi:hypothetical protein FRC08_018210 [Ceratobasidium sp. 394]|nr:hypothetical protein FRC08_018210 [Ceratobasidium sp. 394]
MFHGGLVELHLQDISPSRSLTQQELVAILATCPRLRILALIDCEIGPSEVAPRPVALNHLEFLSLESEYDSGNFVHVLPLLAIGSEGLSMSLTMGDDSDLFDEAKAFFGRTKVTRLHVWGMQEHVPLSMLSYPIPYLEILALEYFDISPPEARNLVLWPRLHTLHLQLPLLDTGCLRRFVELQHSLKKLRVYEPMTEAWLETSMTDEELVDLAQSMHMVEDFEIQSDWKSGTIGTWDFVISERY